MQSVDELKKRLFSVGETLQGRFASLDMLIDDDASGVFDQDFMVMRVSNLVIRMDTMANHGRAHLHIDYKDDRHCATYAIDTGERLVGKPTPYDQTIKSWIDEHRHELMTVWTAVHAGQFPTGIVTKLRESAF
jgi:hypothetical protein